MNRSQMKQEIISNIEKYQNQYGFEFDDGFLSDLTGFLKYTNGNTGMFISELLLLLKLVNQYKENIIQVNPNLYEILKHYDNYYSLHLKVKNFNPRVLVKFLDDDKHPWFASIFNEKEGKKHTDYHANVTIANRRLKQRGKR